MDERQHVRSLAKGLRALVLMNQHEAMSVSDLAGAMGVPRTTAHRLLDSMAAAGYAQRERHADIYVLTSRVTRLASNVHDADWVETGAAPLLAQLGRALRWPLALTTRSGEHMVVRAATDHESPLAIRRFARGYRTPILFTASGLCWLAFQPEEERETVLNALAGSRDPRQALARDRDALEARLAQIRDDGFALMAHMDFPEATVAAPLVRDGAAIGAVVLRYVRNAVDADRAVTELALQVCDAARALAPVCQRDPA